MYQFRSFVSSLLPTGTITPDKATRSTEQLVMFILFSEKGYSVRFPFSYIKCSKSLTKGQCIDFTRALDDDTNEREIKQKTPTKYFRYSLN